MREFANIMVVMAVLVGDLKLGWIVLLVGLSLGVECEVRVNFFCKICGLESRLIYPSSVVELGLIVKDSSALRSKH
jgi:hypothetical protein